MGKLDLSLLVLYLMAAAGYGGWRGRDVGFDWGVWCLLLVPVAWAALEIIAPQVWRRNTIGWASIGFALFMGAYNVVCIGGPALGIAWMTGNMTAWWSPEPAVRALLGVGFAAAIGLLAAKFRKAAEPRWTSDTESTGGTAEPGAAPDTGRM